MIFSVFNSAVRALVRAAACLGVIACAAVQPLRAQGASDIFVVHIHLETTDSHNQYVTVDSVQRITNRAGYNNQPAFLRDGTLLFTAVADTGRNGQADIWMFDARTGTSHPFTNTKPESEYSAYHMPGADRISVIRVETDSTQRLWSFNRTGGDAKPVLKTLKPIGYQAWVDANHVAAFVLGDAATRTPATLQLVDIRDESAIPIASNIGRALQPVPGRAAVSFTRRDSANVRWIDIYDVASKTTTHVVKALPENEYHVWLATGPIISAKGSQLYQYTPGQGSDWTLIADLADKGIKGITRLAISPDGKRIALVAAH
jgi:Tol biopolymer transport system component